MSQGGSRRPFSRGGPRWHPRYKDYWDYDQNYSDGSSAGSPKEACAGSPPPAHHHPHPHHHAHKPRPPIGGGAGGSRRAERRPAGPSDRRRPVAEHRERAGSGAGPSHEAAGYHAPPHQTHQHQAHHHPHMMHAAHHHHMDTNPLAGGEGVGGAGGGSGASSDGEGKLESPARKRRRVQRHAAEPAPPRAHHAPPDRRHHYHHYHPPRRMRYVSGGVWPDRLLDAHHAPLLLDINPMSLRGRLGALPAPAWHPPHRDPHPHPPRNQVSGVGAALAAELWPPAAVLPLRYQMGSVYGGVQYGAFPAAAPRPPFASPPHHHHYMPSQRAEGGRLEAVGEGALSPPDLHHAPLLLATEARGAAIELMAPHHARHALHHHHRRGGAGAGAGAAGGPYVRHAARYQHHPIHHIHTQGGGLVGAALGAHVSAALAIAPPLSLPPPPPPTYQVFLNLLAMFPLSPWGGREAGEARDEAGSPETENYEALLSLAERLGEAKPRGLQRQQIDLLPTYKYCEQTHQGEQSLCVVCMCEFEARQSLRVLPCAHEFHAKCVDKWLRSNRTCPICRGNASDYFNHSE